MMMLMMMIVPSRLFKILCPCFAGYGSDMCMGLDYLACPISRPSLSNLISRMHPLYQPDFCYIFLQSKSSR